MLLSKYIMVLALALSPAAQAQTQSSVGFRDIMLGLQSNRTVGLTAVEFSPGDPEQVQGLTVNGSLHVRYAYNSRGQAEAVWLNGQMIDLRGPNQQWELSFARLRRRATPATDLDFIKIFENYVASVQAMRSATRAPLGRGRQVAAAGDSIAVWFLPIAVSLGTGYLVMDVSRSEEYALIATGSSLLLTSIAIMRIADWVRNNGLNSLLVPLVPPARAELTAQPADAPLVVNPKPPRRYWFSPRPRPGLLPSVIDPRQVNDDRRFARWSTNNVLGAVPATASPATRSEVVNLLQIDENGLATKSLDIDLSNAAKFPILLTAFAGLPPESRLLLNSTDLSAEGIERNFQFIAKRIQPQNEKIAALTPPQKKFVKALLRLVGEARVELLTQLSLGIEPLSTKIKWSLTINDVRTICSRALRTERAQGESHP